ncbi:Hypothetical predicted protein [Olea europaea subsp. europaea]|uniref:Uncharacterized protein n=1 Tax=Olea europaea subsp. europaea TaxID=158383 RepID=A0A8S0QMC3_OLEEU|nr:Hypothetical predicted protein [Olea europaea subsp. europaea]
MDLLIKVFIFSCKEAPPQLRLSCITLKASITSVAAEALAFRLFTYALASIALWKNSLFNLYSLLISIWAFRKKSCERVYRAMLASITSIESQVKTYEEYLSVQYL